MSAFRSQGNYFSEVLDQDKGDELIKHRNTWSRENSQNFLHQQLLMSAAGTLWLKASLRINGRRFWRHEHDVVGGFVSQSKHVLALTLLDWQLPCYLVGDSMYGRKLPFQVQPLQKPFMNHFLQVLIPQRPSFKGTKSVQITRESLEEIMPKRDLPCLINK